MLFSLVKLLSFDGASEPKIVVAAQGGWKGYEFFAFALSNGSLVFRHVSASGVPIIRTFQWKKDAPAAVAPPSSGPGASGVPQAGQQTPSPPQPRSIVAMAFSPCASWLMVILGEGTIFLIPMCAVFPKALLVQPAPQARLTQPTEPTIRHQYFELDPAATTVHEILVLSRSRGAPANISGCSWWVSSDGTQYGIVTSENGYVAIIDFATRTMTEIVTRMAITKAQVVSDAIQGLTVCPDCGV
ncbi:hypothetical protein PAPYR_1335 [Paratrimastix pyriformis]|uniref:Uncharacterized protein n=1 Tax=Paratrimastix pyriformis TaxID=342808 RepID=A0ABQ8UXN9_9EUKA|nr:hypothetical protein PAPYR_1335 [Paratrimastix pyriformis]